MTGLTTRTEPEERLNPERQQQAKAYARIRRSLSLLDLGLGAAYILIFILTGLSPGCATRCIA